MLSPEEELARYRESVLKSLTGQLGFPSLFDFELAGKKYYFSQCPGSGRIGSLAWYPAFVLSKYFEVSPSLCHGRHVIELGCGIGLTGISTLLLGARSAILTDVADVLPLTRRNVAENQLEDRTTVMEYCWGMDPSALLAHGAPDLIIGTDIVYRHMLFEPLVRSLCMLATPQTRVVLALQQRIPAREQKFFDLLGQAFDYARVPPDALHREYSSAQFHLRVVP